jgi:hypothetical protein
MIRNHNKSLESKDDFKAFFPSQAIEYLHAFEFHIYTRSTPGCIAANSSTVMLATQF